MPWRARTVVHYLPRQASRPQLKRDPLGRPHLYMTLAPCHLRLGVRVSLAASLREALTLGPSNDR